MLTMRLPIAAAFVAGLALAAADATAQCYYTAGQKALNAYVPCSSSSGGHSSCCLAGDFCLADGACYGPDTQMTYIAGCTDPEYKDGSCKGGSDTCNKQNQFQGLAVCGNNWVCCGGRGQQGVVPSSDYADTCPCDENYPTAIFNAGTSLAAVHSLATNVPTSRTSPATSTTASSAGSSSATSSSRSPTSKSASSSSSAAATTSPQSASASSAAATTIPLSQNPSGGIRGTGAGSAAAAQTGSSATPTPDNNRLRIGLGVGIPLAVAVVAAVAVAVFCMRRRMLGAARPRYATQADLSTPVYQGEVAGSGLPAAEAGAYNSSGWKQNGGSPAGYTPMREQQHTPPPQYKFGGDESSLHRPESQGILQGNRNGNV